MRKGANHSKLSNFDNTSLHIAEHMCLKFLVGGGGSVSVGAAGGGGVGGEQE